MEQPVELGATIILRPGEMVEELDLDISGWRGRVVEIDEDGDLLIAWDSQTLAEIPETAVANWINNQEDWTCMLLEPEAVLPYEPRDSVTDCLAVARQRTASYGLVFDEITENPLYFDLIDDDLEWDEDDDLGDEEDWSPPYFDLDQFLYGLEIPPKEHPRIRRALSQGLSQYHYDSYGYYKYGKKPADLIPEYMGIPFIFGYGVQAILNHKQISAETKTKICQYAISTIDPPQEDGLPYGLINILSYLAQSDNLPIPILHFIMVNAEYGGVGLFRRSIWHFGTERESLLALLDWLARQSDMPHEEKLYWVWRWGMQTEFDPHLVKALGKNWLAQPNVPDAFKEELCWAWLQEPETVGVPPKIVQVMSAFMAGDREELTKLLADMGPDFPNSPLSLEEFMPPGIEDGEAGMLFQLLHGSRRFTLTSATLKRMAIPTLARLGQDPVTVADMFWGSDTDYYADAIHNGIADLLREFQAQIPATELRRLVEQGVHHGRVNVRKTFHILARKLYGDVYLPLAREDTAKSLRSWAQKQLG